MSESIPMIIIIAVAVIIVAVLVASSFGKVNMGKQIDASATESLASTTSKFDDPVKQTYDNLVVMGTEVNEVISDYTRSGDCAIKVVTKGEAGANTDAACVDGASIGTVYVQGATWITSSGTEVTQAKTVSPTQAINENGTFKGYIRRDVNDAIVLIAFVQQ